MKKNEDGLLRIRGDQIQLCDSNGYWSCLGGTALRSILGIDQLFKRMDCIESGGHDYAFHEKMNPSNYRSIRTPVFYVFKCSETLADR
jgi:hypothetical protein